MIKVILFDADGVLIQSSLFSEQLAKQFGIPWEHTKPFFTGVLKDCVMGHKELKKVLPEYLAVWGWNDSVEAFISCWNEAQNTVDTELFSYIQGLREKGVICCLATNQTKERFDYLSKETVLAQGLDAHYGSAYLQCGKPTEDFYAKIYSDFPNVDKNEIILWDDDQENVDGAKGFGIQAEFYTSFEDFKKQMENYV